MCIRDRSCIHTKFPEYVYERFGIGLDATKGLLKWFHNSAAKTLVNTKSHMEDLSSDGFTDLFLWSRGLMKKSSIQVKREAKKSIYFMSVESQSRRI